MTGQAMAGAGGTAAMISLTTDFGTADPFVGLVKAQILRRCPGALLIDLTHDIHPQRIEEGAFWLERCWCHFPEGSLHLVVVDPGVGGDRALLGVQLAGHLFLGPDNGVLGGIAATPGAELRVVAPRTLERIGCATPSATFHARDLFAPLAGELAAGRLAFAELGQQPTSWVPRPGAEPWIGPSVARGRVVVIDRFGNCFSNLDGKLIARRRPSAIRFAGHELPLVRTYSDRPSGSDVALVNACGVLEAARVGGSAAESLGIGLGSEVEVIWRE